MINKTKLDKELKAAGIPIHGVGESEKVIRIDFKPEATQTQRDQAQAILAAHDPIDYSISVSKEFIRGDRVDSSVVKIVAGGASVNVLVNGVSQSVALVDGVGSFEIVSPSPNTTITITGVSGGLAAVSATIHVL